MDDAYADGDMKPAEKTICIEMYADGTFKVGTEAPGVSENMGEMAEDSGMQPAASIDEALELARQLLQDDGMSPDDQVMAGYNKSAKPKPTGIPVKRVFGE